MTELPHLLVQVDVEVDSHHCIGIAADGLPPKWFTKHENTTFEEDDLPAMLRVIRHAADLATEIGPRGNVFAWWWDLYQAQASWAEQESVPRLLAGLGTSLMERAVIDAVCRHLGTTLHGALVEDAFAVDLAAIRPQLGSIQPLQYLPKQPRAKVIVRHTVGLGDPISEDDIAASERVHDGLPQALVQSIDAYGLKYFKIKLCGDAQQDGDRLARLMSVLPAKVGPSLRFSLDGNEQYRDVDAFRAAWESFQSISEVRDCLERCLLFVEQPLHRDAALARSVGLTLRSWHDAPPIIIDESDATLGSLPTAIELGYRGTSHKNCKGIFKGLVAAATVAQRNDRSQPSILSAEDLGNVGPVALMQDLAMVAALGIEHVERNGHHYFAGLSRFPESIQRRVLAECPDLYHRAEPGFAALTIRQGSLALDSINRAPFGVACTPELSLFESWEF